MTARFSPRTWAYLALLGNALLWGAAAPVVKPALAHITSFQFLFLRYLIAAPIMTPLLFSKDAHKTLRPKNLKSIFGLEALQMFSLLLLYTGLNYTTAIQSSLLINTAPLMMTIAGIIFLKEKEEGHEWAGLIMSMLGTVAILANPLLFNGTSQETHQFSLLGTSLVFICTLVTTVQLILVKKTFVHHSKTTITAISSWIGLVLFGVLCGITGNIPSLEMIMKPEVLLAVLYMGILGTPVALTLQYIGLNLIEASEASLFTYLQPLVYIPLSVLWLHERFSPLQAAGLVVIALGVFLAEYRFRKNRQIIQWQKRGSELLAIITRGH